MAVTPAVIQPSSSTGDAIPLMTTATSGRNNSASFRDGLITTMTTPTNANGYAYPRYGVLGRTMTSSAGANGINDFFVHAPSVPNGLQIVCEPGNAVVKATSTTGGYLVNSKTALALTLDPANASNPRWDLVYLQVSDILAGAASSVVQVAVVTGSPGSSPTVPALPTATTGVQYLKLAAVLVPAAATNLTAATFSDLRTGTSVNQLPRPILGGDVLADAGGAPGERRVRQHASYGFLIDEYGYDGLWHGTKDLPVPSGAIVQNSSTWGTSEAKIWTITIPDPGYNYYVNLTSSVYRQIPGGIDYATMNCRLGSTLTGTIARTVTRDTASAGFTMDIFGEVWNGTAPGTPFSGSQVLTVSGFVGTNTNTGMQNQFCSAVIKPV